MKGWRRWLILLGVPVAMFGVVWGAYGVALWHYYRQGDLDWGIAAGWAQVATAFSFLGGAVFAIVQLEESMRRPTATISLDVAFVSIPLIDDSTSLRLMIRVKNDGDDPAFGVKVCVTRTRLSSSPRLSMSTPTPPGWLRVLDNNDEFTPADQRGEPTEPVIVETVTFARMWPLPPRSGWTVAAVANNPNRTDELHVACWSDNGGERRWENPEMVVVRSALA